MSFLRSLCNRRLFRWLAGAIVSLITLAVLGAAWMNWAGSRAWAAARAGLEAEGETLDFMKLLPPPVADERNFCAIEPLRGIAATESRGAPDEGSPARKRDALKALGLLAEKGAPAFPPLAREDRTGHDLKPWAEFLSKQNAATTAAAPAEKVFQALESSRPLLRALGDAAMARPAAAFLPALGERLPEGSLFEMQLPHYQAMMPAVKALSLRAIAAAQAGEPREALAGTIAGLRLAHAASNEPFLIGMLVGASSFHMSQPPLWELLRTRRLGEADLAALQETLAMLDFEKALARAMRSELAAAVQGMDYARERPAEMLSLFQGALGAREPSLASRFLGAMLPRGFFDLNKAAITRWEHGGIIQPLQTGGLPLALKSGAEASQEAASQRGILHPGSVLAQAVMISIEHVVRAAAAREALRRQALAACALERCRLAERVLPEKLEALVPRFLPAVPAEVTTGEPVQYNRLSDSAFELVANTLADGGRTKEVRWRSDALADGR